MAYHITKNVPRKVYSLKEVWNLLSFVPILMQTIVLPNVLNLFLTVVAYFDPNTIVCFGFKKFLSYTSIQKRMTILSLSVIYIYAAPISTLLEPNKMTKDFLFDLL